MAELGIFIGALAVAYLLPGPDMFLVLQTSAIQGRPQALATAAGLGLARIAQVTLAALGLTTLIATAGWAFDITRIVGAAYLVWVGVGILRSRDLIPDPATAAPLVHRRGSLAAAARRGLLTNITNPKALLFCAFLLPQFVHREAGNVAGQFLLLGAVLVAVGVIFDLTYAGLGAALGRWIADRPLFQRLQRWLFGSVLIAFGVRLAFAQRPG